MLPILITILIIGAVLGVVYVVGSQPSEKQKKLSQRTRGSSQGSRTAKKQPGFRQPPAWLRRLPLILLVGAVAALVVALAQFRIAKSQATPVIALVIDASNSMDSTDVQPDRLTAAEDAAEGFLEKLPEDFAVALVSFADRPEVIAAPSTSHQLVSDALRDPPRGQGTVIGDGLSKAIDEIESWSTGDTPAAIVLLSDGNDTGSKVAPMDAAARAAEAGIPVYTVILGAEQEHGGANTQLLTDIATTTNGQAQTAQSASDLSSIYDQLGSQLSTQLKISSSAQLFVFLAIALAIAAALIYLYLTLGKQP